MRQSVSLDTALGSVPIPPIAPPPERYDELFSVLRRTIPEERLFCDPLRTLAYGTDASFYRLIPRIVVRVDTEAEVITVLSESAKRACPVTFRGAGTSLSGQAISDSVLMAFGDGFRGIAITDGGTRIRLEPAVIGAHANRALLPYGRKIGPDPASINSAMIGGIAANNASGMCCGTAQNSYRTLRSMRVILADGAVLDTGEPASRAAFARTHPEILARLAELGRRTRGSERLAARIRDKYRMKNTTGYSLNALVDFEDPFEILQHLMIGSEGTLAFLSAITYDTVPELPRKSSALMLFADIALACRAIPLLHGGPVAAAELMDRASLRSVEGKPGMPDWLAALDENAAALLVETRAATDEELAANVRAVGQAMASIPLLRPLVFSTVQAEADQLWNIRKGLFPSVGAVRATGTTVVIEDVTFPIPRLAEATVELRQLFDRHGYPDGIIFGHAFDGNLHFVFCQGFNSDEDIARYQRFMDEVVTLVVDRYDGALKGEHGTGRNMAPFVEREWGREAYQTMLEIKAIFDPATLLNPGVILNPSPTAHLEHLKPLPAADPIVDKCIECGFCEVKCPSRALTLTPRQRIVVVREIARLDASGADPARRRALAEAFQYQGLETCATDGLCSTACPVDIDTGKLVKEMRKHGLSPSAHRVAGFLARHMGLVTALVRLALGAVALLSRILGAGFMRGASRLLRRVSGGRLPEWSPQLPGPAQRIPRLVVGGDNPRRVVYLPSCISRTMGLAPVDEAPEADDDDGDSLTRKTQSLLRKAGFEVIYPARLASLCCGMAFSSKGFTDEGAARLAALEAALLEASENGRYPVLMDTSPCHYTLVHKPALDPRLELYEPVQFCLTHLTEHLDFHRVTEAVAVHATCSAIKLGLEGPTRRLAEMCSSRVVVRPSIACCGWAGDRGFTHPELNASALRPLRRELGGACERGYSTSRTCEIGLSVHGGIEYRSILYLVDRCTTARVPRARDVH